MVTQHATKWYRFDRLDKYNAPIKVVIGERGNGKSYAAKERVLNKYAKDKGLDIWVYTGFTWEQLLKMSEKKKIYKEFLENIDVLVDGKFIESQKNLNLLFRGSSNQRLIDVKSHKHQVRLIENIEG